MEVMRPHSRLGRPRSLCTELISSRFSGLEPENLRSTPSYVAQLFCSTPSARNVRISAFKSLTQSPTYAYSFTTTDCFRNRQRPLNLCGGNWSSCPLSRQSLRRVGVPEEISDETR